MIKNEDEDWVNYYYDEFKYSELDDKKVGKWMYYFRGEDGYEFAEAICEAAVENEIVFRAKHNSITSLEDSGVICFYLNCDDYDRHKKVISFLIKNDMIRRTKDGRYYNESFKLNSQTRAGEYGSNFHATIRLSDFIDLKTGEWLKD